MRTISRFLASIGLTIAVAVASAQIPISNLPPATLPLQPTDKVIVNQGTSPAVTKSAQVSAFTSLAPPINATYILQSPNGLIPNSRTLAGTTDEIILADGGPLGNLTLSTPQPIGPLNSPTFAGLTLTSPLTVPSGGTGFSSYVIGDVLSANSTTTLSRIADVSASSFFRSGGVGILPAWSVLKLPNAATLGDLLVATSANTIGVLPDVAVGSYLRSTGVGAAPVYSTTTVPNTSVLGDIWYGSAANVVSALAGNITASKQWLSQTGSGAVSAAPAWSALPGSFSGFANPSATIGLTAVNGVATTCMASDSAPPLSQAIVPTWTGTHLWQQTNTGSFTTIFQNQSTGVAASTRLDIKNSAEALILVNTSTAFSGAFMTGGATGESANIETNATIPVNLGVGGAARLILSTAVAGEQARLITNGTTVTSLGYIGIYDQAGTRFGYFGKAGSADGTVTYDSDAQLKLTGNNGVDSLQIDTAHVLTYNGVNMTPTTTTATWSFQTATSNCSVNGTDATVKLYKIGNVVTARLTSTGTCTTLASSSQATTNAPVPVAFRPANLSYTACITGNGGIPGICGVNTSGQFITTLGTGTSVTWNLGSGTTFTYTLD